MHDNILEPIISCLISILDAQRRLGNLQSKIFILFPCTSIRQDKEMKLQIIISIQVHVCHHAVITTYTTN